MSIVFYNLWRLWVIYFFNFKTYGKDFFNLTLLRHRLVYRNVAGSLHTFPNPSRVAIVAIFPDEYSLPFLINLLKGLKENNFYIVIVSAKQLKGAIEDAILANTHRLIERFEIGRDFGSYQAGMRWLKQQDFYKEVEQLALCNDSLFYPESISRDIKGLLEEGKTSNWLGFFECFEYHYHCQSFFQIFHKSVYTSKAFRNFWRFYIPFSARRFAIDNGEVLLTQKLLKAKLFPFIYYNIFKVRKDLLTRLNAFVLADYFPYLSALKYNITEAQPEILTQLASNKTKEEKIFQYILYLTMQLIPDLWKDRLDTRKFDILVSMDALDIAHKVSILMEYKNPTHSAGMLLNYMYQAPLKRDLALTGIHSIVDLVTLTKGFTDFERECMGYSLRRRGTGMTYRGSRHILRMGGYI